MFLWLHIRRRAGHYKKTCADIRSKLLEAKEPEFAKGTKIVFTWLLDGPSCRPNAMSVFPGLIAVNAEWAARLVLVDDDEVRNCFRFTLGHEMTHQAGDFSFWDIAGRDKKFVNWVSEVHADYGGALTACDGSIDDAVRALLYKSKEWKKDKDYLGHPSWHRRADYLRKGCFDRALVCRIAEDAGCKNSALIERVAMFYEPITLGGSGSCLETDK